MAESKNELWEWGKALLVGVIVAFVIRAFLFTPVAVDGASMEPTLQDQDRMIVTKIGEPKRFEIIVFHAPENKDYIKRVIGLPGDRIEFKDDTLYINGEPYDEPYLNEYKQEITDGGPLTDSFTLLDTPVRSEVVPEGHLFVMGDNRRNSKDSRHIGAVPMDKVVGKTNVIFWPLKDMQILDN